MSDTPNDSAEQVKPNDSAEQVKPAEQATEQQADDPYDIQDPADDGDSFVEEKGPSTTTEDADEERPKDAGSGGGTPAGGQEQDGEFSADLVARAKEAGFTEEEAKAFGNAAALENTLVAIDRKAAALLARSGQAPDAAKPTGEQPEGEPSTQKSDQKGTQKSTQKTGQEDSGAFKLELDEENYDEGLVKALKGLNEHYGRQFSELSKVLAPVRAFVESQEEARFDGFFKELGSEYEDLFGTGTGQELLAGGEETKKLLVNRNKVIEARDELVHLYRNTGRSIPNDAELMKRACMSAFADKTQAIARKQVAGQLDRRSRTAIHRPSGTKGRALGGEAAAIQHIKRVLQTADSAAGTPEGDGL
jgi:hypothetical protein